MTTRRPLSWHDAKPLLEHMDGPVAPADWQGGLPFTYHLGAGRVRAHLKIRMEESLKANYVVEGRIRGTEHPDEWVLVGNHRDAWAFGAADPGSGTAAMLETTRGLGQLAKQGIRPKRTLLFLSWDGEETSFAGSAEWSEQFEHELWQKAVAYLNVDIGVSGPDFEGSSVGSLAPLLVDASKTLKDPSGQSLYDVWHAARARNLKDRDETDPVTDYNLVETRIGSGSDYAALLDHAGVPVLDVSFVGPYGVYHSAYDDFYWMEHFGDPGFRYHTLMAQLLGISVQTALKVLEALTRPNRHSSWLRSDASSPNAGAYHTRGIRRYRTLCIYSSYPDKFLRRNNSSSRMRQTSTGKNGTTRRTLHHEPSAGGIAASKSNAPEYIGCRTYAYGPVDTTGCPSST